MFFCSNCTNYPVRPAPFRYTGANEDEAFYGVSRKERIFPRRIAILGRCQEDENERTGLKGILKQRYLIDTSPAGDSWATAYGFTRTTLTVLEEARYSPRRPIGRLSSSTPLIWILTFLELCRVISDPNNVWIKINFLILASHPLNFRNTNYFRLFNAMKI